MRLLFGFLTILLVSIKSFAILEVVGDTYGAIGYDLAAQIPQPITLVFKNTGSAPESLSIVDLILGADKFVIASNRCVNVSVGKSCQVTVVPLRNNGIGIHTFTLSNATRAHNVIDSRLAEGQQAESVIVASPTSFSLDFTDGARNKVISLSLKNNSKVPTTLSFSWEPADQLGAILVLNRCSTQLGAYKSCVISYRINLPAQGTNIVQNLKVKEGAIEKASIPLTVYRQGLAGPTQPPMVEVILNPMSLFYNSPSTFSNLALETYEEQIVFFGYPNISKLFNRLFISQVFQDTAQPEETPITIKGSVRHNDSQGNVVIGGPLNAMFKSNLVSQSFDRSELSALSNRLDRVNYERPKSEIAHTTSGKLFTFGELEETDTNDYDAESAAIRLYPESGSPTVHNLPIGCHKVSVKSKEYGSYADSFFIHNNGTIVVSYQCQGSMFISVVRDEGMDTYSVGNIYAYDFDKNSQNTILVASTSDGGSSVDVDRITIGNLTPTRLFSYQRNELSSFNWQVVSDGIYVLGSLNNSLKNVSVSKFSFAGVETNIINSSSSFEIDAPNGLSALFVEGSDSSISLVHSSMYNGGTSSFIRKVNSLPMEVFPIELGQGVDYKLAFLDSMQVDSNFSIIGLIDSDSGVGDPDAPTYLIYFRKNSVASLKIISYANEKAIRNLNGDKLRYLLSADQVFVSYANPDNQSGGYLKIDLESESVYDYPISVPVDSQLGFNLAIKDSIAYFLTDNPFDFLFFGTLGPAPFPAIEVNSIDLSNPPPVSSIQLSNVKSQLEGQATLVATGTDFMQYIDGSLYLQTINYNVQISPDGQAPNNRTEIKFKIFKLE